MNPKFKPAENMLHFRYVDLTPRDRAELRSEYAKAQGNLCPFCKCDLDGPPSEAVRTTKLVLSMFPPRFLKHPVHLQHDHRTGMTEAAIHARCNGVLWQEFGR